mgnify:CR=1 FL=1
MDSSRFLFIHIPKCAGSSVRHGLRKLPALAGKKRPSMHPFYDRNRSPHFSIEEYIENDYDINSLFKFCFIRNPIERFASAYFYLRKPDVGPHHDKWHKGARDYITKNYDDINTFVKDWRSLPHSLRSKVHFRSQSSFIKKNSSPSSPLGVDFIGKVENLQQDFDLVLKKIGYNDQISLKIMNYTSTSKPNYKRLFNEKSICTLKRIYADDFDLYSKT